MGTIQDLLQEVPLAAVLRERVALAEQKYEAALRENAELKKRVTALEQENATLRAQIPQKREGTLDNDTARVLAHLFHAEDEQRDVGIMARALGMDKGVMKYHLDLLDEAGFATVVGGNYLHGHTYWGLTPAGRRHAVEQKLIN